MKTTFSNPVDRDKIRGCLAGAIIGDIIGSPADGLAKEELIVKTGGRGIYDPFTHRPRSRGPKTIFGPTSNSKTLLAVAESIIRQKGVNHQEIADIIRQHNPERQAGDTTLIKAIAPLLMYRVLRREYSMTVISDVKAINTHCGYGQKSFAGSVSYAAALMWPMMVGPISNDLDNTTNMLAAAIIRVIKIDDEYEFFSPMNDALCLGYIRITEFITNKVSCREARCALGTDDSIAESLPRSLMIFIQHLHEFEHAILETANAGGAAASNAMLVGALIGGNSGLSAIPLKWRDGLPEARQMITLADRIIQLAGDDA